MSRTVARCRHCRGRIVLVNAGTRSQYWTHQPEGAAFHDSMHGYCHLTHAEPELERADRGE